MEKQSDYQSIYTHDTVYRPPQEEGSVLLEVALGCSWGKCAFCDFAKDKFELFSLEKIEKNLIGLESLEKEKERIFLLGENAFVMDTQKLLQIIDLTKKHLPKIKEFAMYARIDDILRKSKDELKQLQQAGVCDLHIGIESGSDPILAMMNKGVSTFDIIEATRRLDEAGIGYYVTIILGLGGKEYRNLHALETSRLLNRIHPKQIWCLALKLWSGTPLEKQVRNGEFTMLTPWEMLVEERMLVENLTIKDCFFMDTTVLGKFTVQGFLPDGKEAMINAINLLLGTHMPVEKIQDYQ